MTRPKSVSGVLGLCRVDLANPTHFSPSNYGACGAVCWVCRVYAHAGACTGIIHSVLKGVKTSFFFYASTEKANTPNTPNTNKLNTLFLKAFRCVGFVSGWSFLCRVGGAA